MSQLSLFPKPKSVRREITRYAEAAYHYRRQHSLGITYSHPSMPWWDNLTDEEKEASKKLWPREQ